MKLDRKFGLIICMLLVSCIGVVGCGGEEKEAREQEITVVSGIEFSNGIHPGGWGSCCRGAPHCLIYEGLLTLDLNGVKIPGLAESWEMSDDGKQWTFHLRSGVKFHDGTDFDSEDVKFTCEWNSEHGLKAWWRGFNRVECPDEHTAKLIFDMPRFTMDSELALTENYIMSSTTRLDDEGKPIEAIGTGPFKLVSWSDERAVLERNDSYWGEKPKLEKVVVVVITDPQTTVMALEAGEVDAIQCSRLVSEIPRLKSVPGLKMVTKVGVGTSVIYMGTKNEPFDDIRIRKALNYAIDKDTMVDNLLPDYAMKAEYMFSPGFGKYVNKAARNYEYDPDLAKQLLTDAGWVDSNGDGTLDKDGKSLSLTLIYPTDSADFPAVAEYLQYELGKMGIELSINPVEYAKMREILMSGDFDLILTGQWFIPHDEPSNNYRGYFHSTKGRYHFLSDPDIDALIDQLDATGDREERLNLHYKLQEEILKRAPVVYLYNYYSVMFAKDSVKGIEAPVHSRFYWKSLTEAYIEQFAVDTTEQTPSPDRSSEWMGN